MRGRVQSVLLPSILVGVVSAVAIILLDLLIFAPHVQARLKASGIASLAQVTPPAWQGFLASFYGGITEEVLLRLFLFTLLAWLGSKLSRTLDRRPTLLVLWTANFLAAILFGLGHLPATAAVGLPLDALIVTRAIVLNGLAGVAFGWLYWTFGLESAMLAHFSADICLHVIAPRLLPH